MTKEDIARQIAEDPDVGPFLNEDWFKNAEIKDGEKLSACRNARRKPKI